MAKKGQYLTAPLSEAMMGRLTVTFIIDELDIIVVADVKAVFKVGNDFILNIETTDKIFLVDLKEMNLCSCSMTKPEATLTIFDDEMYRLLDQAVKMDLEILDPSKALYATKFGTTMTTEAFAQAICDHNLKSVRVVPKETYLTEPENKTNKHDLENPAIMGSLREIIVGGADDDC